MVIELTADLSGLPVVPEFRIEASSQWLGHHVHLLPSYILARGDKDGRVSVTLDEGEYVASFKDHDGESHSAVFRVGPHEPSDILMAIKKYNGGAALGRILTRGDSQAR